MTAVILTRNASLTIVDAIRSLPQGCQVLVLDAYSEDSTSALAQREGARVLERHWTDFVDARRFALDQVTTPWVFSLDADERCDARLATALLAIDGACDGYEVLRDTTYRGRPMRIWANEVLLRYFRADRVRIEAHPTMGGTAALHERYVVDGPTQRLPGRLEHDSYPTLASYRTKYTRYTALEAHGLSPSVARLLRELLLLPVRWLRLVLLRGAFLDGIDGIFIASTSALYPLVVALRAYRR